MPKKSDPILEVHGLTIDRGRKILDAVDWVVAPGEHWVVLGANGSGKTALLRAVAGYFPPTSGAVDMLPDGDDPESAYRDWQEIRKMIGFVSNNVAHQIEHDEPVLETVISGRYAMINYWATRTPRADKVLAREVLARVECSHLEKQPWHLLSQGEKQRVLIGRALMTENLRVLMLDEPCAGLDPVAREHFLDFLQRFATAKRSKSGRNPRPTLLMVTHHVEEIVPAFTHALILHRGKVTASGPLATSLNSKNLSAAFESEVTLRKRDGRYALRAAPRGRRGKGMVT